MWNFIIPIVCLFGSLFATIFWSGDLVNNGLVGCFRSANITLAICIAFMGGALGAGIMGVSTKLFSVTKAFDTFVNGMAELISVPFILVCAWSLGSIVKGMGTSEFLIHIVEHYLTPGMVPALVFLFGALISFSTGSSWGVWSIMMPIAFPMAVAFDISIPFVVGAVIGGGLFGDQCSPYLRYDCSLFYRCFLQPYRPCYDADPLRNYGWYFGFRGIPFWRTDRTVCLEYCGYCCYSDSEPVHSDSAYQTALP